MSISERILAKSKYHHLIFRKTDNETVIVLQTFEGGVKDKLTDAHYLVRFDKYYLKEWVDKHIFYDSRKKMFGMRGDSMGNPFIEGLSKKSALENLMNREILRLLNRNDYGLVRYKYFRIYLVCEHRTIFNPNKEYCAPYLSAILYEILKEVLTEPIEKCLDELAKEGTNI